MKNVLHYCTAIFSSIFLLCSSSFVFAATNPVLDAEIAQYKKDFAGDVIQVKNAVDRLEWTGITDVGLFDAIADRLQANYLDRSKSGMELNSWLVKPLGLSGQEKYQVLFSKIMEEKKLRQLYNNTAKAAKRQSEFQHWNLIISAGTEKAITQDGLNRIRLTNMLDSGDKVLEGAATERIHSDYKKDQALLKKINNLLLVSYRQNDRVHISNWMCRTLGESGLEEFKPTLEKVANDPLTHKKVRAYAKKYLTVK